MLQMEYNGRIMAKNGLKGISFSCIIGKDWLTLHPVFGRMDSFKNDILGVTLNFRPLTCSFPSDFLMGGGNLKPLYIKYLREAPHCGSLALCVCTGQQSTYQYYYAQNN